MVNTLNSCQNDGMAGVIFYNFYTSRNLIQAQTVTKVNKHLAVKQYTRYMRTMPKQASQIINQPNKINIVPSIFHCKDKHYFDGKRTNTTIVAALNQMLASACPGKTSATGHTQPQCVRSSQHILAQPH